MLNKEKIENNLILYDENQTNIDFYRSSNSTLAKLRQNLINKYCMQVKHKNQDGTKSDATFSIVYGDRSSHPCQCAATQRLCPNESTFRGKVQAQANQNLSSIVISTNHMWQLSDGMKDFISDHKETQNKNASEDTIFEDAVDKKLNNQ